MKTLQLAAETLKKFDYKFKHYFLSENVEEIETSDVIYLYSFAIVPAIIFVSTILIVY